MGKKDDRLTDATTKSAERLLGSLSNLGNIRVRKMVGGHGVFKEDKMFALVDSDGLIFFKADDSNIKLFEEAGSNKHGRMPYYHVPDEILNDKSVLQKWAKSSIKVSRNVK